ncbi:MAG: InlB B-repeat-containing protein [Treponema sp.]|nr:InlB B-repeat-containing protein [Treponema sp.]
MRRLFDIFKLVFATALLFFTSCSGLYAPQYDDSESGSATLRVSIQDEMRTALPEFDKESLTYITLYYWNDVDYETVGSWTSIQEMNGSVVPFKTGTYTFSLLAMNSSAMFTQQKTCTIVNGTNSLSFTPHITTMGDMTSGKGNLDIKLRFNDSNVRKVTAGLYSTEETKIPGFNDEELAIQSGGKIEYIKNGENSIPSGNYIVIFKFYADAAKTQLLGTYREYASIMNRLTSKSECVVDSLGNLFKITYDLGGGSFTSGYTAPGSYTRHTDTIILPPEEKITKAGNSFAGWYESADFTGSPQYLLTRGSSGNKTYHAKWIPDITILYVANGGKIEKTTQTAQRGQNVTLMSAVTLGLKPPFEGSNFVGWAKDSKAREKDYDDGATISGGFEENTVLYALWTITGINGDPGKDSDDDGLSDGDELEIYHTDPSNPDTDGDGFKDGEEIYLHNNNTNMFNPLIADMPELEIEFVGKPQIFYEYTTSSGSSSSESVDYSTSEEGSSSISNSSSKSRDETHGWSAGFKISQKVSTSGTESEAGLEFGYNGNITTGDSFSYSRDSSSGWSKSWSNSKTTSTETGRSVNGGKIVFQCRFKNPSNIAYEVKGATVSLNRIPNNNGKASVPVLTETLSNVGTLGPGRTSGTFNVKSDLTLAETEELLKWSTGMELIVSGYSIALEGRDFTEAMTKVKAQTAALYIDWGSGLEGARKPETYNVAVKNRFNANATTWQDKYTEMDLKWVFDNILNYREGTDYVLEEAGGNKFLKSIDGVENQASAKDGVWFISHKYTVNGRRMGMAYLPFMSDTADKWNFADIKINAGDEISIIYTVDRDGDGVPLNEELIYGTDDSTPDTDGDGLTDYEEIYGWYKADIGLDGKYNGTTKKVYTSPVLKDSDGDGDLDNNGNPINRLDYSADSNKRDSDPMVPFAKNDTSLIMTRYSATGATNSLQSFTFTNDKATLSGLNDRIFLDIVPKLSLSTVKYRNTTRKPGSDYSDFDRFTPIELNVGENKVEIECIAPDGTTRKVYEITVNSEFKLLSNFEATSQPFGGGLTSFTWDSYADMRAEATTDGGYVLYGVKASSLTTPPELTLGNATSARTQSSGLDSLGAFYLKLDPADLSKGAYSLMLAAHTDYCFALYAYAHSSNAGTFKSRCLASSQTSTKTGASEKGTLKFYAHYVEAVKDQDGGCDPEYYWSFSGGGGILDLSALNITEPERKEFDDDDDKYYAFGDQKTYKMNTPPSKFGSTTKVYTVEVSRAKDLSFTIKWNAIEYDRGSPDDHLGTVTANFTYNKDTDTWKCSWSAAGNGVKNAHAESSTITAGDRSNGNSWKLYNEDEGEIAMHWDWSWDE